MQYIIIMLQLIRETSCNLIIHSKMHKMAKKDTKATTTKNPCDVELFCACPKLPLRMPDLTPLVGQLRTVYIGQFPDFSCVHPLVFLKLLYMSIFRTSQVSVHDIENI